MLKACLDCLEIRKLPSLWLDKQPGSTSIYTARKKMEWHTRAKINKQRVSWDQCTRLKQAKKKKKAFAGLLSISFASTGWRFRHIDKQKVKSITGKSISLISFLSLVWVYELKIQYSKWIKRKTGNGYLYCYTVTPLDAVGQILGKYSSLKLLMLLSPSNWSTIFLSSVRS